MMSGEHFLPLRDHLLVSMGALRGFLGLGFYLRPGDHYVDPVADVLLVLVGVLHVLLTCLTLF